MVFLSGLPRTGSTLLASILNQHPSVFASGTSPLMDLLCLTDRSMTSLKSQYVMESKEQEDNIYQGLFDSFYRHIDREYIFDKHRGWPRNSLTLKRFIKEPRIICTVRPIAEIIASYIILILKFPQEQNFVDRELMNAHRPLTTENRAMLLWERYVQDPYQSVIVGLQNAPELILSISYKELTSDPQKTLAKIFDFARIPCPKDPRFFDFNNIKNITPEKDEEGWGMPGLHNIRPVLRVESPPPVEILGSQLTAYFSQFDLPS